MEYLRNLMGSVDTAASFLVYVLIALLFELAEFFGERIGGFYLLRRGQFSNNFKTHLIISFHKTI